MILKLDSASAGKELVESNVSDVYQVTLDCRLLAAKVNP